MKINSKKYPALSQIFNGSITDIDKSLSLAAIPQGTAFYKASLETKHFSFECYADTEKDVLGIMEKALREHFKNKPSSQDEGVAIQSLMKDVEVYQLLMGAGYRDRELLVK